MTPQDQKKRKTAEAAIEYIRDARVIGVGTGSTVNHFIDCLIDFKIDIEGAVSSSEGTTQRLKEAGISVLDLNDVDEIKVYIDGADEVDPHKQLIKGGGGALTREKIIADACSQFVCIVDESKMVDTLGAFPLPIEVIPMSRSYVARQVMSRFGGQPEWRENFITDNGNQIIDIHNLDITDPIALEKAINDIPGVITVGLFAIKPADIILIASDDEIKVM